MRIRTASFEFDPVTGEVHRDGGIHRLEPQPSALLALLMSRPGELLTRAEAIHALWGDQTTVNFQEGLDYSVRQVRIALGDRARPARYVETVPRRGYRFVGSIDQPAAPVRQRPARRHVWTAAALAATLLVGATALVERRPNRHHQIAVTILRAVHDRLF